MKTKFAKRFLVAMAIIAAVAALCVMGACGKDDSVAGTYTFLYENDLLQEQTCQFVLDKDGTATFSVTDDPYVQEQYVGTYTNDGTTVTITGLKNTDDTSPYTYPGLWNFINSENGDCKIEVDKKAGTFTPYSLETTDTGNSGSENTGSGSDGTDTESGAAVVGTYVYAETKSIMGSDATENSTLVLYDDGTCTLASDSFVPAVAGPYTGTYVVIENDGVYISGLTDETLGDIPGSDASMGYSYVLNQQCKVSLDDTDNSFTPVAIQGIYTYTEEVTTEYFSSSETHELVLYADGTCTLHNLDALMPTLSAVYYGTYQTDLADTTKITVSNLADAEGTQIPGSEETMGFSYVTNQGFTATLTETTTTETDEDGETTTTTTEYTFDPTSASTGDVEE